MQITLQKEFSSQRYESKAVVQSEQTDRFLIVKSYILYLMKYSEMFWIFSLFVEYEEAQNPSQFK